MSRVYDYLLGGSAHWSIDRSFAQRILDLFEDFKNIALANRMFVNRAVRHLAGEGIRQFLDIGSGALSTGNTHQVADEIAPCRVVYVDNDPIAVAHTTLLLDEDGDPRRHAVIDADLRYPYDVWKEAEATGAFDPDEPVAVLLFSVLHTIPPEPGGNDDGARAVAGYRDLLPSGSYLGVSHVTCDGIPEALVGKLGKLKRLCQEWGGADPSCRSRREIEAFLEDLEPVEPGLVWIPDWHPEDTRGPVQVTFQQPGHSALLAGIGRKR